MTVLFSIHFQKYCKPENSCHFSVIRSIYCNVAFKVSIDSSWKTKLEYFWKLYLRRSLQIKSCENADFSLQIYHNWNSFIAWSRKILLRTANIFPHSDGILRDTRYLSVFSPNAGKCRPEKLQIRTLFAHCQLPNFVLTLPFIPILSFIFFITVDA